MNKDQDRPRMGPRGRIIWRYWLPWPLMPCKKKGPRAHKSSARRFPSTGDANARIASAHQWIEIGTRRKTNIKIFNINNIESIPLALICNGKTGFSPKKTSSRPPVFSFAKRPAVLILRLWPDLVFPSLRSSVQLLLAPACGWKLEKAAQAVRAMHCRAGRAGGCLGR
jgi:hypothetical protein